MNKRFVALAVLAITSFAFTACRRDAPMTQTHPWDASCGSEDSNTACLQLHFSGKDHLQRYDTNSLTGSLHWALYKGGDVSVLGPGDHDALYEGDVDAVDLSQPGGEGYSLFIPGAKAGAYQSLAYVDHDESGDSGDGDAVTFPSDPFQIPAGEMTRIEIVLDYVR